MKTCFRIPRILQTYCEGKQEIEVEGQTVGELLDDLKHRYPQLHQCLRDETGSVRRHIHLFLNEDLLVGPKAFETRLKSDDVVSVFQAVSGG